MGNSSLLGHKETQSHSSVRAGPRTAHLTIDDIADLNYENPGSVRLPRGVGVVECIT